MAIQTYDDITTISRHTYTAADLLAAAGQWIGEAIAETVADYLLQGAGLTVIDLAEGVAKWAVAGNGARTVTLLRASAPNAEPVQVAFFGDTGRAGVACRGEADWTDAESADDALERYFGVNGKEMVP